MAEFGVRASPQSQRGRGSKTSDAGWGTEGGQDGFQRRGRSLDWDVRRSSKSVCVCLCVCVCGGGMFCLKGLRLSCSGAEC